VHPQLLHQIADDRVLGRRRSLPAPVRRRPPTRGGGVATRLRSGVGTLLIAAGTRLAAPRPRPVGVPTTPT